MNNDLALIDRMSIINLPIDGDNFWLKLLGGDDDDPVEQQFIETVLETFNLKPKTVSVLVNEDYKTEYDGEDIFVDHPVFDEDVDDWSIMPDLMDYTYIDEVAYSTSSNTIKIDFYSGGTIYLKLK